MKKNISINLQGIIFHIEEDGYDILSRYLNEVKMHFANYQGHEDIVADIEGRIAELFAARISPIQQVISLYDVETMIAKMGRVRDFAVEFDEDDEAATAAADPAAGGTFGPDGTFGPNGPFGPKGPFGKEGPFGPKGPFAVGNEPDGSPKRLYRDMAHRKIGGVAAGMAQYFNISPLWTRLGWVLLALFSPTLINIFRGRFGDEHFDVSLGGWAVVGYIILWIVLPKRYDAPAPVDSSLADGPLPGRKYYRDVDHGKIGGVAAGLAYYLRIDVTLIRIVLLAGLFAGGFTFLLYIILWIVAPQAKTVADKMRMQGEDMTLQGFDSKLRNSPFDEAAPVGGNRPVGAFLEDLGRNLRPLVDFVASVFRVGAGALMSLVGFALLLALAIALGVGVGFIPNSENIIMGNLPVHVLLSGIADWGILAGFLVAGIPALVLFLGGLNLLLRRSIMSRTVGLTLFGLWLLGIVGVVMTVARHSRDFQYDAEVEAVTPYPSLTTPVLFLDEHSIDRHTDQWPNVRLAALDSGRTVEVLRIMSAKGSSEADARRTAGSSIAYSVRVSGDSSLVFDDHFSFQPNARFRDQDLDVVIRLPRDRTFRLSRGFAYLLGDNGFVGNNRPSDPEKYRYRLRGSKLECMGCPDEDTSQDEEDYDDGRDDDGRNNLTLNYGGAPTFSTDLNSYGPDRKTFEERDFNEVQVQGGYRVVVRHGNSFRIEAAGRSTDLRDLRIERDGNELDIRPRRSGIWGAFDNKNEKVLIVIEMPNIRQLDLAGTVRADLSGFPRQERLEVEQAGASHLRLAGDFGKLTFSLAGACRTTAQGSADELELDGAGACELTASELRAREANIDLAGVCKARVQVSETLKADAVGACVVEYSGNPANVNTDATGASRVRKL